MIVVDSITFHFRQDFCGADGLAQRSRVLCQMAQDLMRVAEVHELAIVFVNQVGLKACPVINQVAH